MLSLPNDPTLTVEQREVRKKLVEIRLYYKTKMDNDIKAQQEKKDERKLKQIKITIDSNALNILGRFGPALNKSLLKLTALSLQMHNRKIRALNIFGNMI